jgi:hypothetical protein
MAIPLDLIGSMLWVAAARGRVFGERPTVAAGPAIDRDDSDTHTGTSSTANAERDGAPGTKIEVTPEMVEAGALVVASFFDEVVAYGSEIAKLTAIEVYLAMRRVQDENALKKL